MPFYGEEAEEKATSVTAIMSYKRTKDTKQVIVLIISLEIICMYENKKEMCKW